jgi:hypothetical protein
MLLPWILAVVVAAVCVAVRIGMIASVGLQTGSVGHDASIIGQSSQHSEPNFLIKLSQSPKSCHS